MALLIPVPLLHLHASHWALLYLLQHTALGQKRPLQSYRSVPLRILQPKYHTLPFYKTPPYYKQITSAVRTSRAGTKTGSRNYISPCAACEWASSSGGGVPQRHPRHQNDGQIIFLCPDYRIYRRCVMTTALFIPVSGEEVPGLHSLISQTYGMHMRRLAGI